MACCESCSLDIFLRAELRTRNPGGVRFGSAEIYDVIELCFSPSVMANLAHVIVDCLVVGQSIDRGADERVILFVQLTEGATLSIDLEKKIKAEVRMRRTPRHVPAMVRCLPQCRPGTLLMKVRSFKWKIYHIH